MCVFLHVHMSVHSLICSVAGVYEHVCHSDNSANVCMKGKSRGTDVDRWGEEGWKTLSVSCPSVYVYVCVLIYVCVCEH